MKTMFLLTFALSLALHADAQDAFCNRDAKVGSRSILRSGESGAIGRTDKSKALAMSDGQFFVYRTDLRIQVAGATPGTNSGPLCLEADRDGGAQILPCDCRKKNQRFHFWRPQYASGDEYILYNLANREVVTWNGLDEELQMLNYRDSINRDENKFLWTVVVGDAFFLGSSTNVV